MAKLTAGGDSGIDVAFVSGQFAQALNEPGLLEPIHDDLVPNLANLYPEATELAYDQGNDYSVPYTWGTTGICYRSDLVDPAPTSGTTSSSPTRRTTARPPCCRPSAGWRCPAQKALGYSVNTTDDAEIEARSRSSWSRPRRTCSPTTTPPSTSKLMSGEAVDGRGLGRLVQLRHRPRTPTSSSWCPRRAATSGPTRWSC